MSIGVHATTVFDYLFRSCLFCSDWVFFGVWACRVCRRFSFVCVCEGSLFCMFFVAGSIQVQNDETIMSTKSVRVVTTDQDNLIWILSFRSPHYLTKEGTASEESLSDWCSGHNHGHEMQQPEEGGTDEVFFAQPTALEGRRENPIYS